MSSLTRDQQRELIRIAISAFDSELDGLSTGAQWKQHLGQDEIESIVNCDENASQQDILQQIVTAYRRADPVWSQSERLRDDSREKLQRSVLEDMLRAERARDGSAVVTLQRDAEALQRLANRTSRLMPPLQDIAESGELLLEYLVDLDELQRRVYVELLLRIAGDLESAGENSASPREQDRVELQRYHNALKLIASRFSDGEPIGAGDCGHGADALERLKEIVNRFDRVANDPGYRQISGLWGFRALRVALTEYVISPEQRNRMALAAAASALENDLFRLNNGASWTAFFSVDDLTGINTDSRELTPAEQDRLIALVNSFDRIAGDPQYTTIAELPAFDLIFVALLEVVEDITHERVAAVNDPHINLPGGTWLANGYTAETRDEFDVEVSPDAADKSREFLWGSSVPGARAAIWQVGRAGYAPFSASEEDVFANGLVLAGESEGTPGKFSVDFGRLVADLNLVAAVSPPVEEFAPLAGLKPQLTSLFPVQTGVGGPMGLSPAFLNRGGSIIFHVRVIPVTSLGSTAPIGQPSNVIKVYYGTKPDDHSFEFVSDEEFDPQLPPKSPPSLRVFSFQYEPMKSYCIAHRDTSDCHTYRGEGRSGFSQLFEDIAGAWNFLSDFYQEIKSAVVSAVADALNSALALIDDDLQIPESVLSDALDGALVAVGIPPSIPNLSELLDQNAELLAQKIVEEAGVPEELAEIAREKVKNGLIEGARATQDALIRNDGEGTPCERQTDYPYFLVGFENTGSSTCTDVRLNIHGDSFECPFATGVFSIPSLGPGERVVLPMYMRRSKHDRFWDSAFYDETAWYQAYVSDVFPITVTAIMYYTTEPAEIHSMEPLYGSPSRVWNTAYVENR